MTSTSPVLMQMLDNQMRYMAQRQALLSQNISNLDTPGYKAQDLKKLDFATLTEGASSRLPMMATSGKHLASPGAGAFAAMKVRQSFETKPVGNDINLEEEMAKVSDTGTQYNMSTSLMKKYIAMYHKALGAQ